MPRSTSKSAADNTRSAESGPTAKTKKRKNLSLNDQTLDTIEQLKQSTDAATAAEIVRRALKLYAMAVEKERAGGRILCEDADGKGIGFVVL
jgi:hypothetical protein